MRDGRGRGEWEDTLMALHSTQQIDGGLRINHDLANLPGLDLKKLEKLAQNLAGSAATDPFTLLSTVIIFELLDSHFRAQRAKIKKMPKTPIAWKD